MLAKRYRIHSTFLCMVRNIINQLNPQAYLWLSLEPLDQISISDLTARRQNLCLSFPVFWFCWLGLLARSSLLRYGVWCRIVTFSASFLSFVICSVLRDILLKYSWYAFCNCPNLVVLRYGASTRSRDTSDKSIDIKSSANLPCRCNHLASISSIMSRTA